MVLSLGPSPIVGRTLLRSCDTARRRRSGYLVPVTVARGRPLRRTEGMSRFEAAGARASLNRVRR